MKTIQTLLSIGFILVVLGSLFKVMHWAGANIILIFGAAFLIFSGLKHIFRLNTRSDS